jgi:hypothetical protein
MAFKQAGSKMPTASVILQKTGLDDTPESRQTAWERQAAKPRKWIIGISFPIDRRLAASRVHRTPAARAGR